MRLGDLPDRLIARRVGTAQRMLAAHRRDVRSLSKGTKAPRVPDDLVDQNCIAYTELASGEVQRMLPDWDTIPIPIIW